MEVVDNILDVTRNVLQESQEISNTSAKLVLLLKHQINPYVCRILEAVESVTENIPITNTSEPVVITQRSFAVSVQQVDIEKFKQSGETFSVNFDFEDLLSRNQSLDSNDLTFGSANEQSIAAITLPNNLLSSIPNLSNNSRITNAVFITDSLFLSRSDILKVSSLIISAAVVGTHTLEQRQLPVSLRFITNPVSI